MLLITAQLVQTSVQSKVCLRSALVAECPRAPLLLNVPLHCSRLADWSVTLKMRLLEPQNRGLATFPENKIRDSRFSQVFPERSAMQENEIVREKCGAQM